jgi:ABC-2 type transport system ATP-binding protein
LFRREKISKDAVKAISFDIEAGELVGFLGPNGAGKTTTMKMLSGIIHPSNGDARVLGCVPWHREKVLLKKIALVMGQKGQLCWDLPAADSFLLFKDIYEINNHDYKIRLDELVDLFELGTLLHLPVRQLSLGERMKCELAASLLHSPDLLFLDEPTIGLDIISQRKLRSFLKSYNAAHGLSILLTSHYMQDIKELCSRVVVINHGVIIYDGSIQNLMKGFSGVRLAKFTWAEQASFERLSLLRPRLEKVGILRELDKWSCILEISESKADSIASDIGSIIRIEDIAIEEPDIENVMESLFTQTREAAR